ncbi:HD domain-containing protein [bacterium]|nr:HD domain-containing protein [bacterium]MBU3954907.1 HD domain-containing protein [bacterium]MBU4133920.1 HD domain-containing protein [bacterium]
MEEDKQILLLRETVAQLDLRCRVIGDLIKLMDLTVGKDEFISRAARILGDAVHTEIMIAVIDSASGQFCFYPLKNEDELLDGDMEKREYALKIFRGIEDGSGHVENEGFMCSPIGSGKDTRGMVVAFNSDRNEKFPPHEVRLFNEVSGLLQKIMEKTVLITDMNRSIVKMQKLFDVVKEFSKAPNFKKFLDSCVRAAADIAECEGASVLLLNGQKDTLRFEAVSGDCSQKLLGVEFPAGEGIAGWAIKNGREAIINEAAESEHFSSRVDEIAGSSTRNLMVVPLGDETEPLGVMEAVNKINGQDFSARDMLNFSILASQITQMMKMPSLSGEFSETFIETAALLLDTIEAGYSPDLKHSRNMLSSALALALAMGLDEKEARNISLAALLHDIGKIAVPSEILQKPEPLTDEEWAIMKTHPEAGSKILARVKAFSELIPYIKSHHEKWDGTGYPEGLKGNDIPLGARIITICDAFDAMISDRNYGRKFTVAAAIEELIVNSSKQFDPECVKAAIPIFKKIEESV